MRGTAPRGVTPRIDLRKGVDPNKRLNRYRCVAEILLAQRYCHPLVCFAMRDHIHHVSFELGCALIYWDFFDKGLLYF
jgi:hypothetical protein